MSKKFLIRISQFFLILILINILDFYLWVFNKVISFESLFSVLILIYSVHFYFSKIRNRYNEVDKDTLMINWFMIWFCSINLLLNVVNLIILVLVSK